MLQFSKLLRFPNSPAKETSDVCNCAGFRTPECKDHPRALAAGVRKAPRHEIAGCWHRRCSGGYGDLAAAWVSGTLKRGGRSDRFALKRGRACRGEQADRTLRRKICGAIAGRSVGPTQAGALPAESQQE